MRARARAEWTPPDLVIAANLARAFGDVERISAELEDESDIILSSRGTPVANPKYAILEQLSRRILALTRVLQIQPAASGKAEDKAPARKAEAKARAAVAELEGEGDLIPMS